MRERRIRPNQEVGFFTSYQSERFTLNETEVLRPFFSNLDKPVYVIRNLPPLVAAALIGRQSQTLLPPRTLFLREFVKDLGLAENWAPSGLEEFVDIERADKFFQKYFAERGHDSLGDLPVIYLGFEQVSQLGAKALEDTRVGIAPLERSTRYSQFGQYGKDPEIMRSSYAQPYCQTTEELIATYTSLLEPVKEKLRRKYPEKNEWWIKNRAFDLVRVLLPASILTNLGLCLNGRAAEYLIIKLKASELSEIRELGLMMEEEIRKVNPAIVARVRGEFGEDSVEYLTETSSEMKGLAEEVLPEIELPQGMQVCLVDYDPKGEEKVIAAMLWKVARGISEEELRRIVREMDQEMKTRIVDAYIGKRRNRRQKPGRALERTFYRFEVIAPFGIYRDLQRHRMLTQERQDLTFDYGYHIPEELVEFGFGPVIREATERAMEVYYQIRRDFPAQAQYMTTFGALTCWYFNLNLREALHLTELRTSGGAHPEYKRVAQMIKAQIERVHPTIARCFKFVDMEEYKR